MKTVGEWQDYTQKLANDLEHKASLKCSKEIEKAKAYHEGYTQAIEDFAQNMREEISQNQG